MKKILIKLKTTPFWKNFLLFILIPFYRIFWEYIINFEGNRTSSSYELGGQNTLIYFWSQTQMNHYRRTIRRVEELKRLYPDYRFVGICIQPYTDMVSQAQNILNLDLSNQYSFQDFEKSSKSWVLTFLNKTIIIDEKSKIIDGFSNLFTNEIEQILNLN